MKNALLLQSNEPALLNEFANSFETRKKTRAYINDQGLF